LTFNYLAAVGVVYHENVFASATQPEPATRTNRRFFVQLEDLCCLFGIGVDDYNSLLGPRDFVVGIDDADNAVKRMVLRHEVLH
jgi:hypothetical protein